MINLVTVCGVAKSVCESGEGKILTVQVSEYNSRTGEMHTIDIPFYFNGKKAGQIATFQPYDMISVQGKVTRGNKLFSFLGIFANKIFSYDGTPVVLDVRREE